MVMVFNPALQVLRKGMEEAKMTQQELFDAYRDRGGKAKQPNTLGSWLRGERDVPSLQLALLYSCVNEALAAKGLDLIELPFRHGLVEDDNRPKLEVLEYKPFVSQVAKAEIDASIRKPSFQQRAA